MDKKYLIVNTGSASKKYSFYIGEQKVYNAHFEMEDSLPIVTESAEDKKEKRKIAKKEYDYAISLIVESFIGKELSDEMAEEYLAEQFRSYMLLGKDNYKFSANESLKKRIFEKI